MKGDEDNNSHAPSPSPPPPETVIAHTNLTWGMHGVAGRETGTATTADVTFG